MEQAKKLVDELSEQICAVRDQLFELEWKQYHAGVRLELLKFCNLPECAYKWLKKRDCILSVKSIHPDDDETVVKYDVTMKVGNNAFHAGYGPFSLHSCIMINIDGEAQKLSTKTKSDEEAKTYVTDRLNGLNCPIADPGQEITESRWNDAIQKLTDDDIEFVLCIRMFQSAACWMEEEGCQEWGAVSELSDIVFASDE